MPFYLVTSLAGRLDHVTGFPYPFRMTAKEPLSVTHPELANQAVGWDPSTVTAGSSIKREWKCSLGHKWKVAVEYRTRGKTNCPVCAGKKVLRGFNDLAYLFPEIGKEANGWDPGTFSSSSGKKMQWKCTRGHLYIAAIYSRTGKSKSGCPVCTNRKILVGVNDLATTHPAIAQQAIGWDPTTVSAGMGRRKYKWVCPEGHLYDAYVYSRTSGVNCSICSNMTIQVGINDLMSTHPALAKEAVGWDPAEYVSGTPTILSWRCPLGHSYKASIVNRARKGTGCPTCANKKVLAGFNDIATTNPKLAREAFGWDPEKEHTGSHKKLRWKCENGHTWDAVVTSRVRGNNCPVCANKVTRLGTNDLKTTNPDIAKQAEGWDPSQFNAGSHEKKDWRCPQGHVWDAPINSRMRGDGEGCPICSNHRILAGFNDLATTHPQLLPEVYKWNPTIVSAGSGSKRQWICREGHIWTAVIQQRTGSRQTGCPSCAKFGYDINRDGYLYFLNHPDWKMLQIGVTNSPETRLPRHRSIGWEVIELRGPMDGLIAREWEISILQMLKRHGAKLAPEEIAGKFDGYTEAWTTHSFSSYSLRHMMDLVLEDESHNSK